MAEQAAAVGSHREQPVRQRSNSDATSMSMMNRLFQSNDSTTALLRSTFNTSDVAINEDIFKSNGSIINGMFSTNSNDATTPKRGTRRSGDSFEANFNSSDSLLNRLVAASEEINSRNERMQGDKVQQEPDKTLSSVNPTQRLHQTTSDAPKNMSTMFSSRDWFPEYKGKNVDIDLEKVFHAGEVRGNSAAAAPRAGGGSIDWDAVFEADLAGGEEVKPEAIASDKALKTDAISPASTMSAPPARGPKRKREKSNSNDAEIVYVEPRDEDVLLGRGGRTNNHPGNKHYLTQKDRIQPRYLAASKADKTGISQELVDLVHNWGGRFLKLKESSQQWYEVTPRVARKKCSQSLREINTPEERAAKRARYSRN